MKPDDNETGSLPSPRDRKSDRHHDKSSVRVEKDNNIKNLLDKIRKYTAARKHSY
jgi:hypothetical protein